MPVSSSGPNSLIHPINGDTFYLAGTFLTSGKIAMNQTGKKFLLLRSLQSTGLIDEKVMRQVGKMYA